MSGPTQSDHVTLDLDKGKLTGEVYTFSQKDHVVVLRERTTEDRCNIHFVNSRKIRNYTVHNSDKRDQAFDVGKWSRAYSSHRPWTVTSSLIALLRHCRGSRVKRKE
ncbi:MAG: uncharacterized protein KVP18_000866 [Porospora cf. gigantea A]|uniref:uncharacterized protein n=1 Tax=Porospora cf. gigantea A TaxID=2853593 RepID=UPI0035599152|nr:MAG: hypothetical protein KVP18_000866 [Porospora cf. gigantea A]